MKNKIKLVISQRVEYFPEINELRDTLDIRLINWIQHLGALPFPVPNNIFNENSILVWLNIIKPDAIILSGGNDIGIYEDRDSTEKLIIEFSKKNKIPLLGICRGMQMLASIEGITLEKVSNHSKLMHSIKSLNNKIHFPSIINSYHNFRIKDCPSEYEVTAISDDGTIEAILHRKLPLSGWMWHPERDNPFSEKLTKIAQKFFLIK